MYTEIRIHASYFNRDTKQNSVTRQNAKKHEVNYQYTLVTVFRV